MPVTAHPSKDPLHGVTLEMQINALVARYGWAQLGKLIKINCFKRSQRQIQPQIFAPHAMGTRRSRSPLS